MCMYDDFFGFVLGISSGIDRGILPAPRWTETRIDFTHTKKMSNDNTISSMVFFWGGGIYFTDNE